MYPIVKKIHQSIVFALCFFAAVILGITFLIMSATDGQEFRGEK